MSLESICLAQRSMLVEEALIGPLPFFHEPHAITAFSNICTSLLQNFGRPDGIGRASTRHIRNNQLWRSQCIGHRFAPSRQRCQESFRDQVSGLWRTPSYRVYPSLTCACARSSPDRAAGDGGCSRRGSVLERERGDDDQE